MSSDVKVGIWLFVSVAKSQLTNKKVPLLVYTTYYCILGNVAKKVFSYEYSLEARGNDVSPMIVSLNCYDNGFYK